MTIGIFEKWSERASRAIETSAMVAKEEHSSYVGTHHLLLALMCDQQSVASKALWQMGIDLTKTREAVRSVLAATELPSSPLAAMEERLTGLEQRLNAMEKKAKE